MNGENEGSTDTSSAQGSRRNLWIAAAVAAVLLAVAAIWWFQGQTTVPNVTGGTQEQAAASLQAAGLAVGKRSDDPTLAVAPGTVTNQSPAPETRVSKGTQVDLSVASAPTISVPDVVGKHASEAEADLAVAGLRVGEVDGIYSTDVPEGTVISQSPEQSAVVTVASAVNLEISAGPKQGAVPDVTGLVTADAQSVLETAGFKVTQNSKTSADVAAGVVISQSPVPGTAAQEGTTVSITVSTGAPAEAAPPAAESPNVPSPPPPAEQPQAPTTPPAEKPEPEPVATEVPDLVGMRVVEALNELRKVELGFKIAWAAADDSILRVAEQDPEAGTEVDPGSVVTITIGLPSFLFEGPQVQPLPSVPSTETTTSGY